MNKRIYKYPLAIADTQNIFMPRGAEILSVENQGGIICLWAMVDAAAPIELRSIEIIGTGNPVPADMGIDRKFIGTVLNRPFVWHVFERM